MPLRTRIADRSRRAANAALDPRLIEEVCAARWLAENREAIAASNAYADERGLPLTFTRLF